MTDAPAPSFFLTVPRDFERVFTGAAVLLKVRVRYYAQNKEQIIKNNLRLQYAVQLLFFVQALNYYKNIEVDEWH
jgi:hypothetical protein